MNKKGLLWEIGVFFLCVLCVVGDVSVLEREGLSALYKATQGQNWIDNHNWNSEKHACTWFGVVCDFNATTVVRLDLPSNNLNGTLPSEISALVNLKEMFLQRNSLRGLVPSEIGLLSSLTWINLHINSLSGALPTQMGDLHQLEIMSFEWNSITNLPSELGNIAALSFMNFFGNDISGEIPSEFGQLTNLLSLSLQKNNLVGSIPSELCKCPLQILNLGFNSLDGNLPVEINCLDGMTILDISDNSIHGSIPTEFGYPSTLFELNLEGNFLEGSIPPELGNSRLSILKLGNNSLVSSIPSELGKLSFLTQLSLEDNYLSGSIPRELCTLSLQELNLLNNSITGTIPTELAIATHLTTLNLGHNDLNGTIPTELGQLNQLEKLVLEMNSLEGTLPNELGNIDDLVEFKAGNNKLFGEIPAWANYLDQLWLNNNNFRGQITHSNPLCNLNSLNLAENPDFYCACPYCNPCEGLCISQSLSQERILTMLYTNTEGESWTKKKNWLEPPPCHCTANGTKGDVELNWEGVVCECAKTQNENFKVRRVLLSDVGAKGHLPDDFFVNLPYLAELDLSQNQLHGSLPVVVGDFIGSMNLSHNRLGGRVGDSVCPIATLDLRENRWWCPVPICCQKKGVHEGMCEPCNIYRWYFLVPMSLFAAVLLSFVGVVLWFRQTQEAFVYVEEEEDVVSLLTDPSLSNESGGEIEPHPHDERGWWKTPGGRFSSVLDVSEEYIPLCQSLLDSQSTNGSLTVVGVYHVENSSLWRLYTATQSSILSSFPKRLLDYSPSEENTSLLSSTRSSPTLPHYQRSSLTSSSPSPSPSSLSFLPSTQSPSISPDPDSHPLLAPIFPNCYQHWMAEKLDLRVKAREALLFHGTNEEYVNIIKDQGFDSRIGSLDGNFGSGCYFSDDVRKAIQYCTPDESGVSYVFLGRVCLGCPHYMKEGQNMKGVRRAPTGKTSGRVYDSVIGCVDSRYQEYVVYDKAQCYPELLIAFQKKGAKYEAGGVRGRLGSFKESSGDSLYEL